MSEKKRPVNDMEVLNTVTSESVEMRYLGCSGLKVSNICLGTMTFGQFPGCSASNTNEADSHKLLDRYVEMGGNFIDTADCYPGLAMCPKLSEEIVGTWLSPRDREKVVLATKCRFLMEKGGHNSVGLSRKHVLWSLKQSLERLKTDYIDLYQIHAWDAGTPIEETMRTLNDAVRSGKVHHIGACNLSGWQLQKVCDIAKYMGLEKMITNQVQYSLLVRGIEDEVNYVCKEEQVGIMAWSPLKGGWLTGKIKRGVEAPSGTRHEWSVKTGMANQAMPGNTINNDATWKVLDVVKEIADAKGKSMAEVSLRWLIQKPLVSTVIIGATKMSQLESNMSVSSGWSLTPEEMSRLDDASAQEPRYPYVMANRQAGRERELFTPL